MFFTQLLTSVSGIPISMYHFGRSSSKRFCIRTDWFTSALLWVTVGAILVLFLFTLLHIYSPSYFFVRGLIHSGLSSTAAFLRHPISVVFNICFPLLVRVLFSLWYSRVGGEYRCIMGVSVVMLISLCTSVRKRWGGGAGFDIFLAATFPNNYTP